MIKRLVFAAVTVAGLVALALCDRQALVDRVLEGVAAVEGLGLVGIALYALLFVVATLVFTPTASLDMVAGLVFVKPYGMVAACVIACVCKTLAISVHYFLGRFVLQGYVRNKVMPKFPVFRAADRAVETEPWKMTTVIRFAPMPNIAKNFGIGALGVSFHVFLVVSGLFGAPWSVAAVVVGSQLTSLPEVLDGRGKEKLSELLSPVIKNPAIAWVLCILGAILMYYAYKAMKKAYDDIIGDEGKKGS